MDIKGAFENVPYQGLMDALHQKQVPQDIILLYSALLTTRTTTAINEKSGHNIAIAHTRGAQQGGILIRTWLCTEPWMQDWSTCNDIQFCPKKSENILFNWTGKKLPDLPSLKMYSTQLTCTNVTRYLGLEINNRLTWWAHIKSQIKKAKYLIIKSNGAQGKLWGPKPPMIKWTLDAVITPKILYGSHLWNSLLDLHKLQDLIRPVNRLGMLTIAPCQLDTPTRGLEIMFGYIPLHLKAKMKNIVTKARLTLHHPDLPLVGHMRDSHVSHQTMGLANFPLDDTPPIPTQTLFKTYIDTPLPQDVTQPWITLAKRIYVEEEGVPNPIITIFTDSSKIDNAKDIWGTGAGYAIFCGTDISSMQLNPPIKEELINLCHSKSVFQAEITAILRALLGYHEARRLGQIKFPPALIIYSDSQAAIKALQSTIVKSQTVLECQRLLNATTLCTPVHIKWVKAHATSAGNNYVVSLAKKGALSPTTWDTHPRTSVSLTFIKNILWEQIQDEWMQEWQRHQTCRQTKLWFPSPNPGLSRKILRLDRPMIGRLIRWLTGHNFLRRHSNLIDPVTYSDAKCRLCGMEQETSSHVLADCITLDYNLLEVFKMTHMTLPYQWNLNHICNFQTEFTDTMEDLTDLQRPISILTRTSSRTIILDTVARPANLQLDDSPFMNVD